MGRLLANKLLLILMGAMFYWSLEQAENQTVQGELLDPP